MEVPIRPHVGVFALFSAIDYKAWFALGEFVDNALQSWITVKPSLPESARLRIEISTGRPGVGPITIRDNAGGIPKDRFISAFQPAKPPPDASGLSVYGIGMKSASAWFGHKLVVRTSAFEEPHLRTISFDFEDIVENGREQIPVTQETASPELHFTEVTISDLIHPIQTTTHTKIKSHLASIYRSFLRREDIDMFYDSEKLSFTSPEPLLAKGAFTGGPQSDVLWRKNIHLDLGQGRSIDGFAGIRSRADTKGLLTFWRGGWDDR